MKSRIIFFFMAIAFLSTTCRNGNKNNGKGQSLPSDELAQSVFKNDSSSNNELAQKLIGYWQGVKSDLWIEFRPDGTYMLGKGNKWTKRTVKYKVNTQDTTIIIQTKKRIKEFPFSFSGNVLIIQQDKGEFRYVKVEKKPQF